MLFSKTAKAAGGTGFFFDGDASAPEDSIVVAQAKVNEALALPHGSTFDFDQDGELTYTLPTVESVRAAAAAVRWELIKTKRDSLKAGGVKVGTKWYHSDADSRIQFLGLKDQARDLLAAGQPDTTRLQKLGQDVRWKTMSGDFIYLTVKHAFDIVAAIGDLDAMAFAAAETHRAAMEASADPAAYDFSVGWPATFAG